MKPSDNHSNQCNANKGTSGYNAQYQAMLDNRSHQLNPMDSKYQGRKKIMCSCCGKDGKRKNLYPTESEAMVVAGERRFATGITMHVYRCPEGGGWHITSNQRQW